jgi:probable HAF family extracellular repeat protein
MNNNGDFVGTYTGGGAMQAFAVRGGVVQELYTSDRRNSTAALRINDAGVVEGYDNTHGHSLVWSPSGKLIVDQFYWIYDLNNAGHYTSSHGHPLTSYIWTGTGLNGTDLGIDCGPLCLNDLDEVAGTLGPKVYLWSRGVFTALPSPPGLRCRPSSLNNNHMCVGSNYDQPFHALLWQPGQVTDIGRLPGFDDAAADHINNLNQVVGVCIWANQIYDGFIYQNGVMSDLNDLADGLGVYHINEAKWINDRGQILVRLSRAGTQNIVPGVLTPIG